MRRRPRLIAVRMIATDVPGLYGMACEYSDGVTYQEAWGSREETELAVALRDRDIYAPQNLKP
jgi:hypothetical protein